MNTRSSAFALVGFSAVLASAIPALADDIVACRFSDDGGGCSRFQGYVFVHHKNDGGAMKTSADRVSGDGVAAMSGERLYLGVNSQSER